MCGIAGLTTRAQFDKHSLDSALTSLRHRGPDDSGTYIDASGRVGLVHTRLSILDLSQGGHQPMKTSCGRAAITFNGEIYNFTTVRAELSARGHVFKSSSDTEVLLAAYMEYGIGVLDKINGIFAFAIHDSRDDTLFVARDQLGVKPLYFVQTDREVVFASEIKAILNLVAIDRSIDVSAIQRYLTFLWCPGEQTPFACIKKLEPGCAIIARDGRILRKWKYWDLPQYEPRAQWTAEECAEELNDLLNRCVRRQMISDAPVGAFLSGGIDSSAIVAAAKQVDPEIACFTIKTLGESEGGTDDDLPYARLAARHLNADLHVVEMNPSALCDNIANMVQILEEPLADPACMNLHFMSLAARERGIKVLLSGTGGDDLFSGYRRHALLAFETVLANIPSPVYRGLEWIVRGADARLDWQRRLVKAIKTAASEGNRRITSSFMWTSPSDAARLLSGDAEASITSANSVDAPLLAFIDSATNLPAIERCLMLEKRFFLGDHNMLYTDKMGMAAGVEIRVPFLDLELLNFSAQVPVEWKHRFRRSKWILKESQRKVLPDEIIDRSKTGFGVPLRKWMRGPMRELVHELLSHKSIEQRGLFNPSAVQALIFANERGAVDASYSLFSIMCIEMWCRYFVDRPSSELPNVAVPRVTGDITAAHSNAARAQ